MRNVLKLIVSAIIAVIFISACDGQPTPQSEELDRQQQGYTDLTKAQPIEKMKYSPTRNSINKWIKTWDQPGKLSFMYLMTANGDYLGYYVLEGLPVSYCTVGSPPYTWVDRPGDGSNTKHEVEAPAMDGVYYSGFECNRYYGFEAETGKFLDWVRSDGQIQFVTDSPEKGINTGPLLGGTTTVEDVEDSLKN